MGPHVLNHGVERPGLALASEQYFQPALPAAEDDHPSPTLSLLASSRWPFFLRPWQADDNLPVDLH